MLFAGLKPAQVSLQAEHHALEQEPGSRALGFGHRGALRVHRGDGMKRGPAGLFRA
jgi:hypothetical protein